MVLNSMINLDATQNGSNIQDGANGLDMSPVKALADVKLQSQTTDKAITDNQNQVKTDRTNLTNTFLNTLEQGKADNSNYNYFPNEVDLNPEQQLKLQSIKNKFGLSDLKTTNPNDILKVFKDTQAAQYNSQFTPIEIKPYTPFANIVQDYNNANYKPIAEPKNSNINMSSQFDTGAIQSYIDKYSVGGSLMTANDFINASKNSGVSIDALLTQARLESNFGTQGRAKNTKNALNYGNDDAGNNKTFNSYSEGLAFAAKKLVDVFGDGNGKFTADSFINRNFIGKYGRYATDPEYGSKYSSILGQTRSSLIPVNTNNNTANNNINIDPTTLTKKDTLQRAYNGTAYVIDDKNSINSFGDPLKTMNINSGFIYRPSAGGGFNIGSSGQQLNVGIDLQANIGTPFYAVTDAKVFDTSTDSDGNKKVVLLANNGVYAQYNHISGANVKIGQTVKKGDLLGQTGASGGVTGPHLDFALYRKDGNGKYYYIDSNGKY